MNRVDYIDKMCSILNSDKFQIVSGAWTAINTKLEDKVNRLVAKLNKLKHTFAENLIVTGSSPGVIYGLSKIYKPNVPLRPILAAYNTAIYRIAKFLVSVLGHLIFNQYSLKILKSLLSDYYSLESPINTKLSVTLSNLSLPKSRSKKQ